MLRTLKNSSVAIGLKFLLASMSPNCLWIINECF